MNDGSMNQYEDVDYIQFGGVFQNTQTQQQAQLPKQRPQQQQYQNQQQEQQLNQQQPQAQLQEQRAQQQQYQHQPQEQQRQQQALPQQPIHQREQEQNHQTLSPSRRQVYTEDQDLLLKKVAETFNIGRGQESRKSSTAQSVSNFSNTPQNLFSNPSSAYRNFRTPIMTSSPILDQSLGATALPRNGGPFRSQTYSPRTDDSGIMNLGALNLASGETRSENLHQKQEEKRLSLESKMANVLRLNTQMNRELNAMGSDDVAEDATLHDLKNYFGSTAPGLLAPDYTTRMSILEELNKNLEETINRKSRRLQGLQEERINLANLPKRERNNLQ